MIKLIEIEFEKFIKRKSFYIALILFTIIFIVSMVIYTYRGVKVMDPQHYIDNLKKQINQYEEQKVAGDKKYVKTYEKFINDFKLEVNNLEIMQDESIPWEERVQIDIEFSKDKTKRLKAVPSIVEAERSNILLKEYYLENNIPYDYSNKLEAFDLIPDMLYSVGFLGLFIIVGVMVVDVVAGENKPATIKFLVTKPIERWKIIFAKFLVSVVVINILILVFEAIYFIILGFIFGFGDPSLPVLAGTTYTSVAPAYVEEIKSITKPILGSTVLISQGTLIVKVLIIQGLGITACISFCLLCSTIIENAGIATGVAITSIVLTQGITLQRFTNMNYLEKSSSINKVLPFLFPSYYDCRGVVSGKMNEVLGVTFINFNFVVMVMLGWIVICYGISHMIFVKKDITA
ncbi:ABC transporter permease subunit [Clostridium sp.]|uniref:ABC transporter permease subunit n=1 Tax=Clostridium sp. TaxID=1506 RepID=UPI003216467B